VERFEVEVFDWLRGERVKRPIPDYETLELADPKDAIQADAVQVRARVVPSYILSPLVSFTEAAPGSGRQPIPAGEVSLLAEGVFHGFWLGLSNPRYLYALLHGVGCRLIASLLFGARPRDEVERLLFERAVVDTGERSRQRVVLLERLLHPDFIRQKGLRDPWALASLRLWTEVELLRAAALAAAAAWPRRCIPYPPWSPRPDFFLVYRWSDEDVLDEWLRDSMEFEETAERCGIPFARPEPLPPPVDGETARRALTSLYWLLLERPEARGTTPPPVEALPSLANAFANYENIVLVETVLE
jgi:hypothetical protein